MILSLTLTNFMAHASTTLELAPGLNVLCGPNNTGKSAVVEALRCLASNPTPRHVIRHGASEARVEALLDSGWRVAWVRRKGYALYEVFEPGGEDPQVYAKLGRSGVPPEVAELLKLSPVLFEKGSEVDVHLGDQRHPIFLLDQPGSLLADFLASSTESAHLMAMQDLLREKTRRAKTGQRQLEEAMARACAGLDRLSRLPEFSLSLERLHEAGRELEAKAQAVPALQRRVTRLSGLAGEAAALRQRTRTLADLAPPPQLAPSAHLAATLAAAQGLAARASAVKASAETLAPLFAPPELSPAAPLTSGILELGRLRARRREVSRRLMPLSTLEQPPEAADPAPLAWLIGSLEALSARLVTGRAWLIEREKALSTLADTITSRVREIGECPLCGSSLDAGRFLKKAGGHGAA